MAKWVMRKAKNTAAARAGADRASSIFRLVLVASLLGVFTDCGHKGAPLAKDRLRPSLKKAASINNRQILFSFSEAIDLKALKPGDITISADRQTLPIIAFYPSLSDAEIVCVTAPQASVTYEITGVVYDSSENKGVFRTRIAGSTRPDTIRPAARSISQGARKHSVTVQFDKAMDTTSLEAVVLPKKSFRPVWIDLRTVNLVPRDSTDILRYDTTYYFLIRNGRDLSGNAPLPIVTRVTPDTAYQPIYLRGRVEYRDTLSAAGWVVLSRERPIGIARVDQGEFLFEVRDSLAFIADAVRDDLHGRAEVRAGLVNLIDLMPENFDIDSLFN